MKVYFIDAKGMGKVNLSIGAEYQRSFEKSEEPFKVTPEEWEKYMEPTGMFTIEPPRAKSKSSKKSEDET